MLDLIRFVFIFLLLKLHFNKLQSQAIIFCPLFFSQNIGFFKNIYIFLKLWVCFYLFIYGCVGSSFLCEGFLQLRQVGAALHRGARASHHRGLSRCGAQAPDVQAQQLWLTGPAAPRHVGSSQTRARTRVPCIGRQTPNHCATREAPKILFLKEFQPLKISSYLVHSAFLVL